MAAAKGERGTGGVRGGGHHLCPERPGDRRAQVHHAGARGVGHAAPGDAARRGVHPYAPTATRATP
eukprot:4712787-Pleurochrysis_carterae.AAC.1